jgi:hypothetical protein
MIDQTKTKLIVGIVAAVWFLVAVFTGGAVSTTALKTVSIAGTVVTILFLLYDRYIWRWRTVRKFTGVPLIQGTWRGTLRSDYVQPGEDSPGPPIPTVIRIKQTASTFAVTLFTREPESITEQGRLTREPDDRWRLSWLYVNTPRPAVQHRSHQHRGVCDLYLSGRDGESLTGRYSTSRKTTGELSFGEWSKHSYGDAQSALEASDFAKAEPFVRRVGRSEG